MEAIVILFIAGPILAEKWDWALALFAFAGVVWQRIRSAISWIWGLVVITNEVEWAAVVAIVAYMDSMGKINRKQKGRNLFRSSMMHVRPLDKATRVMMVSRTHNDVVFFYKRRPVFYHYAAGADDNCTFSYIRGTVNWKDLLWEVVQWEEAKKQGTGVEEDSARISRFSIQKMFGDAAEDINGATESAPTSRKRTTTSGVDELSEWTPLHWKPNELGESHTASSLDLLSLRNELVDVVEEARFWFNSEDWYKARGIPWRRGFGFHGMPGTGKTSLARALAEDLDLPVFVFDIGSMSNREFSSFWERSTCSNPCMILLEDVDAVFEGRQNKSSRPDSLTFECLINCIDGAKRPDGLLLIITTNHIDRLDPALKRSGRMDRSVEFLPLDREGRLKIASRIVDDAEVARRLVDEGADDPAADFQERCFRVAIEARYKDAAEV